MRLYVIALSALVALPALARSPWSRDIGGDLQRGEVQRDLRLRFEVRNTTGSAIEGATLEAFVPAAEAGAQRLLRVDVSHAATLRQEAGQALVAVSLPRLPPHGVAVITVTARVAVGASGPAPRPGRWALSAEPLIEVDDPRIKAAAAKLERGSAGETAKAVYDHVTGAISKAGFTARDRGAAEALASGRGDCSEMAYLFVALARAAGVPARYMGGYVTASSALLAPRDYHNWAEWYDGRTWRVADPHAGVFDEAHDRFIATNVGGAPGRPLLGGAHRYRVDARGLRARMVGGR